MTNVVFSYILTLAPGHAPFFVRPLVKAITGAISAQTADPNVTAALNMVRLVYRVSHVSG